ncbi:MAG: 4Fe-4S dicluster domain-containing protein [Deltaproteobacteria bacterium]|nr:4Fe-4S dicluster domain-containing protein [Deltaproteobacteria bacterium]
MILSSIQNSLSSVIFGIVFLSSFALFFFSLNKKLTVLKFGQEQNRFDLKKKRFLNLIKLALFQRKLVRYRFSGLIHIIIFWGFLILLLNTLTLWTRFFIKGFYFISPESYAGLSYLFLKDIFSTLVLTGASFILFYRLLFKPKRMKNNFEAYLILTIIIVMMTGDLFYWAGNIFFEGDNLKATPEPVAELIANLFTQFNVSSNAVTVIADTGFYIHSVLVLVFLNILPYGKHFHVITALPNVFLMKLDPPGRLPLDRAIEGALLNEDSEDENMTFGAGKITDFTWKDMLDFYSCTECGRCYDRCPAANSGKNLSPQKIIENLKSGLSTIYDKNNNANKSTDTLSKSSITSLINTSDIWECTTCLACDTECPLTINVVDKIVKMRRYQVEEKGALPKELAAALKGIELNSNPWNLPKSAGDQLAEKINIQTFNKENCEYLFFAGCAAAFDSDSQKIAEDFSEILKLAKVTFGYLGSDEPCCGDIARRAGQESAFRMITDSNIEFFKELGVKKIVTICPHCFNTFKNEYPVFNGEFEIIHHTQLLEELLKTEKIIPVKKIDQTVTYHDPCYLGRYNNEYNSSRTILKAIPGLRILETANSKDRSNCCGAGGGRFFMEEKIENRVSYKRVDELTLKDPDVVCTSCPYCKTMLGDGVKDQLPDNNVKTKDVAELLLNSLK